MRFDVLSWVPRMVFLWRMQLFSYGSTEAEIPRKSWIITELQSASISLALYLFGHLLVIQTAYLFYATQHHQRIYQESKHPVAFTITYCTPLSNQKTSNNCNRYHLTHEHRPWKKATFKWKTDRSIPICQGLSWFTRRFLMPGSASLSFVAPGIPPNQQPLKRQRLYQTVKP